MPNQKLNKILNFDESDLSSNRAGRLTDRQSKAVSRSERLDVYISLGVVLFLAVVALIFTFRPIMHMFAQGVTDTKELLIVVVVWLAVGLGIVGNIIKAFKKVDRAVLKAQGRVSFTEVQRRTEFNNSSGAVTNQTLYNMRVGSSNFENVPKDLMNVIESDDTYAFYYVSGYGLLSGENAGKSR
jgi:hypothetical protein